MQSPKFTPLGLDIRRRLDELGKNQKWLVDGVRNDTGMYIDSAYFHRIMIGERNPPRIIASICKILGIEEPQESGET